LPIKRRPPDPIFAAVALVPYSQGRFGVSNASPQPLDLACGFLDVGCDALRECSLTPRRIESQSFNNVAHFDSALRMLACFRVERHVQPFNPAALQVAASVDDTNPERLL
jgi:hypothetical protein